MNVRFIGWDDEKNNGNAMILAISKLPADLASKTSQNTFRGKHHEPGGRACSWPSMQESIVRPRPRQRICIQLVAFMMPLLPIRLDIWIENVTLSFWLGRRSARTFALFFSNMDCIADWSPPKSLLLSRGGVLCTGRKRVSEK